jgi:hypothetical protein
MVKIRYSELPAGLHVAATADNDGTVVYLQPGLTPAQRRAALGRVRSSARMGQGPMLPRPEMAKAIAADRMRTNARIGAAAARRHPLVVLTPVFALVIAAIAVMVVAVKPLSGPSQAKIPATFPALGAGRQGTSAAAHAKTGHGASPAHAETSPSRQQQYRRPQRPSTCTAWPSSSDPRWWAASSASAYHPISMAAPCGRHKRLPRWERIWHS